MTMQITNHEEVPLQEKTTPLCELPVEEAQQLEVVRLRQTNVDVSRIQEKLQQAGEKIWDPEHQVNNVQIKRAGHDRWGIDKVVLRFSDDYLKRVYTFPWYHEWKELLIPVFDTLQIKEEQVIRCLLARMPPSSTIPVHHDTGAWVSESHRIHLPIATDESVDFQVGIAEDKMNRVFFEQGNVYELNNYCKHKVYNGWTKHRVHLIFDYVEPGKALNCLELSPGVVVRQTRRTLDLSTDVRPQPIPDFIIIGAQKAGTTALYDYIVQHPLVLGARRKETHYFDWRWKTEFASLDTDEGLKQHRDLYKQFFHLAELQDYPSIMTGEATPSYMLGGSIVLDRARRLAPHAKLLAVLRDPVERAFSQYQMTADPKGSPEQLRKRGHYERKGRSFEQVVRDELAELKQLNIGPDISAEEFDRVYLKERVKFQHGGHSYIGRGLYALQLELWIKAYGPKNVSVISSRDLKTHLQESMDDVFKYLDLPPHIIQDSSPKNSRKYESIDPVIAKELEEFFQPFNARLSKLIGKDFGW